MGWKQRKRKGTQCDGACPSLIQVQPETRGHGATAATHGCGHSRKHPLFIYLFKMKAQTTKQNNEWRGGIDVTCFSCYCNLSDTDYCLKLSGQMNCLVLLLLFLCGIFGHLLKWLQWRGDRKREKGGGEGTQQRFTAWFERGCCGSWSAPSPKATRVPRLFASSSSVGKNHDC